jgi:hypothetical protein
MSDETIVVMPDNKYVALLNYDDTLAPLVASAEMTNDYLLADGIFKQLLAETAIEKYEDDDGNIRDITRFHPDLKWWFDQKFKIEKEIAKLNMAAGVKEDTMSVDIMKIMLQDKDMLTVAQRKEIGKRLMTMRMKKNDGTST